MKHILYCICAAASRPAYAFLGLMEFRSGEGRTYGDPFTAASLGYDAGRELAHIFTLRRFES